MEGIRILILYLAVPSLLFSVLRQILSRSKKDEGSNQKFPGPAQFPFIGRVHDLDRFCMWILCIRVSDSGISYYYAGVSRTAMISRNEMKRVSWSLTAETLT